MTTLTNVYPQVPDGWKVAKDTLQLRIAMYGGAISFGTWCLITEGGRSFATGDSSDCGSNAVVEYEFEANVCQAICEAYSEWSDLSRVSYI